VFGTAPADAQQSIAKAKRLSGGRGGMLSGTAPADAQQSTAKVKRLFRGEGGGCYPVSLGGRSCGRPPGRDLQNCRTISVNHLKRLELAPMMRILGLG